MMVAAIIDIVAAVIRDDAGRLLLVRKRGTEAFMQPGGKREEGEDDLTALSRELDEELGCSVIAVGTTALGIFEAAAVNEPGRRVCAAVYSAAIEGSIAPRGEIAEIAWVDVTKPITVCLAPLTRDCILPVVQAGGRIDPHASRQYMARAIPASGEGDDR